MRPRDIGTRAETAVVRYLAGNGFPYAERRSLKGALDQGDVTGIPGVCIEIKGGDAARNAGDGQVWKWMLETDAERLNARAGIGVLVVQRHRAPVERWWVVVPFLNIGPKLALDAPDKALSIAPVRLYLRDAVIMLRCMCHGVAWPDETGAT